MFDVLSTHAPHGDTDRAFAGLPPKRPLQVETLQKDLWNILGRALCIRHVDAGSCNGCELEIQALNNPYYNLEGSRHQIRRQPAPCRPVAGNRPGIGEHGRGSEAHL